MSIKQTFYSFYSAASLVDQTLKMVDKRENDENQNINIELNIDQVILAGMAQPALLAFSIELGLKYLLVKSKTKQNPRGHKLKELFCQLPNEIKDTIYKDVTNHIENIDFYKLLEESSNNFVDWRYFHEKGDLSSNGEFLGKLLNSINTQLTTR